MKDVSRKAVADAIESLNWVVNRLDFAAIRATPTEKRAMKRIAYEALGSAQALATLLEQQEGSGR